MDIADVRLKCEFLALETLVVAVTRAMARGSPAFEQSLRETGNQALENYRLIAMPDRNPLEADLITGEFREAWERLLQRVLSQEP